MNALQREYARSKAAKETLSKQVRNGEYEMWSAFEDAEIAFNEAVDNLVEWGLAQLGNTQKDSLKDLFEKAKSNRATRQKVAHICFTLCT